jgi:hypothetical protein
MTCDLINTMTAALFTGSITAASLVFAGANRIIKDEIESMQDCWSEWNNKKEKLTRVIEELKINRFKEIENKTSEANKLIEIYKIDNNKKEMEKYSNYLVLLSKNQEKHNKTFKEIDETIKRLENYQINELKFTALILKLIFYIIIILFLVSSLCSMIFWYTCSDLWLNISKIVFIMGVCIFLVTICGQLIESYISARKKNKEFENLENLAQIRNSNNFKEEENLDNNINQFMN